MHGRSVEEYSALCTLMMRLLRDYLEEDCARVWVAKRRSQLYVWLDSIASLLHSDNTNGDKLWIPRSRGQFLLKRKYCAPPCGRNNVETFASGKCPGFFKITTPEEYASPFACPGSTLRIFYTAAKKCALEKTLLVEPFTIPAFSLIVGHGHLQDAKARHERSFCFRYYTYFILCYASLKVPIYFAYRATFSIQSTATYSINDYPDDANAVSDLDLKDCKYSLVV